MAVLSHQKRTEIIDATAESEAVRQYAGMSISSVGQRRRAIDTKFLTVRDPRTVPTVSEIEAGDADELNESQENEVASSGIGNRKARATRIELARKLSSLAEHLLENRGKAQMTADLLLLKRELAGAHAVLRNLRSERDYLSVISLIEAGLQNVNWKVVSREELSLIHTCLWIGVEDTQVDFDDVNASAKRLRGAGVSTLPVFEIDYDEAETETDSGPSGPPEKA